MVQHEVLVMVLVLRVIGECPVDELVGRPDERAVIVHSVVVIDAAHHGPIEAVDPAAVTHDAVVYLLPVEQLLHFGRQGLGGHRGDLLAFRYRHGVRLVESL